jgi:hypothetical protein
MSTGPGASRTRLDFVSMDIEGGRYLNGGGSVTFPASSPVADLFQGSTIGQEFKEATLRVYYRGATTPLWTGIMGSSIMRSNGETGEVEIVFEEAAGHALRRRLITTTGQADVVFAGLDAADNIALSLLTTHVGSASVEPTGYPGGLNRANFGSFTFDVAALHGPALSASVPDATMQSGGTLLDTLPEFMEQEDLALLCTDDQDGSFNLDTDYPYVDADLTATVIFSTWLGNLASFQATTDTKSLANVWSVEGKTPATSHIYTYNSASVTAWGITEAHGASPQETDNAAATSDLADYMAARYGNGTLTYDVEIVESTGCLFNVDWGLRDTVRFVDAAQGFDFNETCTGFQLSAEDGGPPKLSFTFGTPRLDTAEQVKEWTGTRGPRFSGSRWRTKRAP